MYNIWSGHIIRESNVFQSYYQVHLKLLLEFSMQILMISDVIWSSVIDQHFFLNYIFFWTRIGIVHLGMKMNSLWKAHPINPIDIY